MLIHSFHIVSHEHVFHMMIITVFYFYILMQLVYNILSGVPRSRSKGFLSYKLLGNFLATCGFWSNVLATFAVCSNF